MEVAEHICTRIGIIYQGGIIAEGTLEQIKSQVGGKGETLEEIFLKATNEESEIANTTELLREAFSKH
jgi:ABC-2 type transport system ATP-binding protein